MGEDSRTALRIGGGDPDPHEATQKVSSELPLSVGTMRATPAPGTLIGSYVVEKVIGVGGMGIVLAARHSELGELAAIKLLHPKAAKDEVQRERFVREARATVRIKSEHVVRVLDAGKDKVTGAPFIVMEHLEGRDLARILEAQGAMPVTMAVDIMLQICEAVAAAHALGIIHRDLKPSNFFVVERAGHSPLVKVLDFGISKASEQNGVPDPRLTETQAVFGSPTYMSPEQIRSSKNVDPRSDVWSLGIGLFEMLTGKLPFIADNVPGLLASVVADAPFRISVFAPDVPPELEAVVLACLEKNVAKRVSSAVELARLLAPFASEEGAALAARIARIDRAGAPRTHPSVPPGAQLSVPPSGPSAPAAFGGTGDLSATGPSGVAGRPANGKARMLALSVLMTGGAVLAVLSVVRPGFVTRAASDAFRRTPSATADVAPSPLPLAAPEPLPSPAAPVASAIASSALGVAEPVTSSSARRVVRLPLAASGHAQPVASVTAPSASAAPAPPQPTTAKPKPDDDRF